MRVLLDTHYLIWLAREPSKIAAHILKQMREATDIFVSPVSLQEIGIKHKKRPEEFEFTVTQAEQTIRDLRCLEMPYRLEHARQIDRLPSYHSDPFDHILIAQAIVEQLTLLSADRLVVQYAGEHEIAEGTKRNLSILR